VLDAASFAVGRSDGLWAMFLGSMAWVGRRAGSGGCWRMGRVCGEFEKELGGLERRLLGFQSIQMRFFEMV